MSTDKEEYVCSLDENSLKVAKDELNEDPKERLGQVETLRQWIKQQPHLKFPTDTKILLPFLRTCKFSQLRARNMIDRFVTQKTILSEWFSNLDMRDPKLLKVLESGMTILLPGRVNGRKVLISRVGVLELTGKNYNSLDFARAGLGLYLSLVMMDETTQVHGTMGLRDFTDVSMNILKFISMEELKKGSKIWENTIPGRLKGFHFYNAGPVLDTLMALTRPFLSKKLQSRMHFHGSNLEEVYKVFPMSILPDEYLPDDYTGPRAGPIDKLIAEMKDFVTSDEARNMLLRLTSDDVCVDETKRPEPLPQESFRKLQVD